MRGEDHARRLLEAAGLHVLAARARYRVGEIDLIAIDEDLVVFVEVKSRASERFGSPAEAVTPRKQARLAKAALRYLAARGWLERACRFDVVEVIEEPGCAPRLRHIVDAFRPRPPHRG